MSARDQVDGTLEFDVRVEETDRALLCGCNGPNAECRLSGGNAMTAHHPQQPFARSSC